jgi:L,D-transpeptidase ErfK/SrfK
MMTVGSDHIVPLHMDDGIVVNLPQLMLFLFKDGHVIRHYPIAPGKPDWPTPTGSFEVTEKRKNPTWHVPESIQQEMEDEGKVVKTEVPPGPKNPLAGYWIGLSGGGIGIHGTNAPESISHFRSHGCVRMHKEDAAEVFRYAYVGMPVEIIYEPALMTKLEDGKIFVEVHRDAYEEGVNPIDEIREAASSEALENGIDWNQVREMAHRKDGVARAVTPTGVATAPASPEAPTRMVPAPALRTTVVPVEDERSAIPVDDEQSALE